MVGVARAASTCSRWPSGRRRRRRQPRPLRPRKTVRPATCQATSTRPPRPRSGCRLRRPTRPKVDGAMSVVPLAGAGAARGGARTPRRRRLHTMDAVCWCRTRTWAATRRSRRPADGDDGGAAPAATPTYHGGAGGLAGAVGGDGGGGVVVAAGAAVAAAGAAAVVAAAGDGDGGDGN